MIYSCEEAPFEVCGLPCFKEQGTYTRIPYKMKPYLDPNLYNMGQRGVGGRVRFSTNAEHFTVRMRAQTGDYDEAVSTLGSYGIGVCISNHFMSCVYPHTPTPPISAEKEFVKKEGRETVTLVLPRIATIEHIEIEIDSAAEIAPPKTYVNQKPVIYYGSSITEGGCATHAVNNYEEIISRALNLDYVNLGFSGAAKGEKIMREWICGMDMCAFVLDYDHNAPTPEALQETHEPLFKAVRAAKGDIPIVILSRPDFESDDVSENILRRAIVRKTYENALAAGDKNVYFIDGETFFGSEKSVVCTIDRTHPNDYGFAKMAERLCPILKDALKL